MTQLALDYRRRFTPARSKLLDVLSDMQWHTWSELSGAAGIRFGARLGELREAGYDIETREIETGKSYRLRSLVRGEAPTKRVRLLLSREDAESIARGQPTDAARFEAEIAIGRRP